MTIAKMLRCELKCIDLGFVLAAHSRDLGISTTAGVARPNQINKVRSLKSKHRITNISKTAKQTGEDDNCLPGLVSP